MTKHKDGAPWKANRVYRVLIELRDQYRNEGNAAAANNTENTRLTLDIDTASKLYDIIRHGGKAVDGNSVVISGPFPKA